MNAVAARALKATTRLLRRRFPELPTARHVEYIGMVNYATTERVIEEIRALMADDPTDEILMLVTCAGGPSGTALGFYDLIRTVIRPKLVTVGAGDVDSAGIILFLTGDRRYVTKNTTLLLHLAGRTFDGASRYTASEIDSMVREDRLKDFQYATVLAERSNGRITTEQVLAMMEKNTILTPLELVSYGLADAVLE